MAIPWLVNTNMVYFAYCGYVYSGHFYWNILDIVATFTGTPLDYINLLSYLLVYDILAILIYVCQKGLAYISFPGA